MKQQVPAQNQTAETDVESRVSHVQKHPVQQQIHGSSRQTAQREQLDKLQGSASRREKTNGLPSPLRAGVEALSGMDMGDVVVHRHSAKPAQVNALAYAQGNDIHLGPGQDRHLPHEAWHVVQQAQGRVNPTGQLKGVAVNEDQRLEKEADIMGAKALANPVSQLVRQGSQASSPSSAPAVQRKISYKKGRYESREALINALNKTFGEKAKERILFWVGEYEKASWTEFATAIFDKISTTHLPKDGFKPTYAVVASTDSGSKHGPMLPERVDRTSEPDSEKALGTFNFSSVTLARLTAIGGGDKVVFHDRQIDADFHAEDGLIDQLEAYFNENEVDTKRLRINLTINNFFCAKKTTKKSHKSHHCLGKIIQLQEKFSFARFHVYFQNTYGKEELMSKSIKKLQSAGILVSSFTSVEETAPYVNEHLDPHSESEDDSEDEGYADFSPLGRAREYWKQEIEDIVEQTNAQYEDVDGFEPVDYDDVEEFMKDKVESAFELDYIENEFEFNTYIHDINNASSQYIRSMIKKYA